MSETSQWAPPATRYRCPISACKWTHDDAPDMSEARGKTIEEASAAVIRAHLLRSEKVIEAHLRTHDLIDWAREIARLRGELAREKRDGGLLAAPPAYSAWTRTGNAPRPDSCYRAKAGFVVHVQPGCRCR